MQSAPIVSIILTCYNLEHYIGEAIASLLEQDFKDAYEIIVIDDGSSDGSQPVIDAFKDDRLVKIFFPANKGAAQAITHGFQVARGKYICRFDGDDRWYPDYLSTATAILDNDPEIGIVHSDCTIIDSSGAIVSQRGNVHRPEGLPAKTNEFRYLIRSYYMNAPTMMIRRELWDDVQPWAERFRSGMGDWYYSLLMTSRIDSYFVDRPLAYYRVHANNMHKSYIKDRTGESNAAYVLDHFYRNRHEAFPEKEWRGIFSTWFKSLGMSYFGMSMTKDARRCLTKALKFDRSLLADPGFLRIYFASFVGKETYGRLKSLFPGK